MAENTAKQNFPEEITKVVKQVASEFNIDPALIMAVIKAESGFNSRAVSSAGAMGLMQLMPFTAKTLGVSDPFDIWQNIRGGSRYLKDMLDRFGSIPLALAAYNAGPGSVEKYNGIPPYAETQNYVAKVLKYMESYKAEQASLIT
jgi:Transglycosylase SLT domain.